jgi:hypothetical protein
MKQESTRAIGESVYVGPGRQGWEAVEGVRNIVVGAVHVMIFTRENAVKPVEDMLRYWHVAGKL